ncbi:hypothetical protein EON80_20400 [bacterium]|nr:MAG: hypothetical protein EON80_20400 [bacterium]
MKKLQLPTILGLSAALLLPVTSAHAHFLWGHVTPGAEPTFRLSISEMPGEGTDADHIEQAKDSSAWLVGGKDLKLTNTEGLFVAPVAPDSKVIAAGYSWGAFPEKGKKTLYLLDLYAKAAVTETAAATAANLPLEVFARRDGGQFVATVKSQNKPLAKAEVVVTSPDNKEEKTFTTDKNGSIRFPYTKSGLYTVRAINVSTPRSGSHNGKQYSSVLGFSTLTFTAA